MHRASPVLIGTLLFTVSVPIGAKPDVPIDMGTYPIPGRGKVSVVIHFGSVSRHQDWLTAQQERWFTEPQATAAGPTYRSELDTDVYDCAGNRFAAVTHIRYAGEKLGGDVVETVDHADPANYQWSTPAPGSASESIFKMVCKLGSIKQGNRLAPELRQ